MSFAQEEAQKHPGKVGLQTGFELTVSLISGSHSPFSTELWLHLKAAAVDRGFVPAASVCSPQAVATRGEKQLTSLFFWWLMTKMCCLKAFPDPWRRRRRWWWEQTTRCSLLGADLLPTEGSDNSSGTELEEEDFQVSLTPEILHPVAKATTLGLSLLQFPFAPSSKKMDFSSPVRSLNPSARQDELSQGSASLSQAHPSAMGGFIRPHPSWAVSSHHHGTSRLHASFVPGAGSSRRGNTLLDGWRPSEDQGQGHPINITLQLFFITKRLIWEGTKAASCPCASLLRDIQPLGAFFFCPQQIELALTLKK